MIHFVGAGSGAPDLITVRGKKYLEEADVVIYAGSLVNPKLLEYTKDICTIYNSAKMTLEEVLSVMEKAEASGKTTVRLHTGDPCIYGAIREQCILRCGKCFKSGIYAAGYFPERDHHPYGRQNSGSAKGKHSVLCCSSGNHGCFSQHRNAGRTEQKTDRRRLYGRYSCCDCV